MSNDAKHATRSALDVLLKSVKQHLPLLLETPPSLDSAEDARSILEAGYLAADYLEALGFSPDAQMVRDDAHMLTELLVQYVLSRLAVVMDAEQIEERREEYGSFPMPPADPEEHDTFFSHRRRLCSQRAEILRQNVLRIQGYLKETAEPVSPVHGEAVGDGSESEETTDSKTLTPAVKNAWAAWKLAVEHFEKEPGDREAYDWLKEQDFRGPLFGYELPEFDTWARTLRTARKYHGKQKHQPRAGRETGKTVVRQDEI